MEDLEGFIERLIADASALPEDEMRVTLLRKRLSAFSAEEVVLFFEAFFKRTAHEKGVRKVMSALVDPAGLKRILGPERYTEARREASTQARGASLRRGLKKVSRLFTEPMPRKTGVAGYDKEEEIKMELMTLGQRRALAKGHVKDMLDRLLSDPDPTVVANILNNPRITEKEVLKIASKRPNSPQILKLLAGHRTWSRRYNVIKAIALNPYSPPRVAVALLEFLLIQDIKAVSEDSTLHIEVREGASEILEEKGKGS